MTIEVKVPGFPESVTDGIITAWHKKIGEEVARDEVIADIETDKVVFEIPAPKDGVIDQIFEPEGTVVTAHQVIAKLTEQTISKAATPSNQPPIPAASQPNVQTNPVTPTDETTAVTPSPMSLIAPSAHKLIIEKGLNAAHITGTGKGGRILKEDVISYLEHAKLPEPSPQSSSVATTNISSTNERTEKRVPMTRLRTRIAERLVEAQQTAAILTTFNEVNMQPVMTLRKKYRDSFEKTHGVRLGFMAFFVKAVIEALRRFPEVNASIDASDIVYHGYFDIGIAVGTPRGLVVPILQNADQCSIATIEQKIVDFGQRAKAGKLTLEEITGGTFSITNGGVFGSLLSTPILNPPQSAILGMHKIQERPMVVDGEIKICPMMYVALSYDHRIVDGREAVQFLVTIKDMVEDPARLLLNV